MNNTHVDLQPEAKAPLGQGVIASCEAKEGSHGQTHGGIVTYQVGGKQYVAVTSGAATRLRKNFII